MIFISQVDSNLYKDVFEVKIQNTKGEYVKFFSLGALINAIYVKDKNGELCDIVLGYETPDEYIEKGEFYGTTVGRNANRILGDKLNINGKEYKITKTCEFGQLHGGKVGFDKKNWKIKDKTDNSVTFYLFSPDGDEGFPANLDVYVKYIWDDNSTLTIEHYAKADGDTVCNLTNHSYFNLTGCKANILDTELKINASRYTDADDNVFTNGDIKEVRNTALDFTEFKKIGKDIHSESLKFGGYDHNFCLDGNGFKIAAEAKNEQSGINLICKTTSIGLQLYTTNDGRRLLGKGGKLYENFSGFCLETQFWPCAVNFPHFPSSILKKGEEYRHTTTYSFYV